MTRKQIQVPFKYKGEMVQVASETIRLKAFMHYIFSGSLQKVSRDLGINIKTLVLWSKEDRWNQKREGFYNIVYQEAAESLEKFSHKLSRTINAMFEALGETLSKIPKAEIGSHSDMWRGIKEAAEAIKILSGMAKELEIREKKETDYDDIELSDEEAERIIQTIEAEWREKSEN